jgi:exosortase
MSLHARGWSRRSAWILAALCAASVVAFHHAWMDLFRHGIDRPESRYILWVPACAAFLFWCRRSRLPAVRCRPSLWGPLTVAAASALASYSEAIDLRVGIHLAAVLALLGSVLTMTGLEAIRQFGPVFLALLLIVPMPGSVRQEISRPMQDAAVVLTQATLDLIGVSALRDGSLLVIRGTPVAVGEACDGMRMALALGLTVFTFVFSMPLRWGARLFLVLISPLVAVVCNVIRLVPSSIAFGFAEESTAVRVHEIFGWMMLAVAVVAMFLTLRLVRWLDLPVTRWRLLGT